MRGTSTLLRVIGDFEPEVLVMMQWEKMSRAAALAETGVSLEQVLPQEANLESRGKAISYYSSYVQVAGLICPVHDEAETR